MGRVWKLLFVGVGALTCVFVPGVASAGEPSGSSAEVRDKLFDNQEDEPFERYQVGYANCRVHWDSAVSAMDTMGLRCNAENLDDGPGQSVDMWIMYRAEYWNGSAYVWSAWEKRILRENVSITTSEFLQPSLGPGDSGVLVAPKFYRSFEWKLCADTGTCGNTHAK